MDDYIKRSVAMKIVDTPGYSKHDMLFALKTIPAITILADFLPVVMCKDCRHRDPEDHKCDSGQLERAGCIFPVDDDYFCAYGEKREES